MSSSFVAFAIGRGLPAILAVLGGALLVGGFAWNTLSSMLSNLGLPTPGGGDAVFTGLVLIGVAVTLWLLARPE